MKIENNKSSFSQTCEWNFDEKIHMKEIRIIICCSNEKKKKIHRHAQATYNRI